jgi:hypothetical protein
MKRKFIKENSVISRSIFLVGARNSGLFRPEPDRVGKGAGAELLFFMMLSSVMRKIQSL